MSSKTQCWIKQYRAKRIKKKENCERILKDNLLQENSHIMEIPECEVKEKVIKNLLEKNPISIWEMSHTL